MSTHVAVEDGLDWDVFVERYWDRAPVLLRRVDELPFEPREVFASACAAAEARSAGIVLTTDGIVREIRPELLPGRADEDLDGYARRMLTTGLADSYSLVVAAFHSHRADLWEREQRWLAPLWQRVGLPATSAITTMFHGPYDATPVGVHKDRFGTFMVPLAGRKRMRLWDHAPWAGDATSLHDYHGVLGGSVAVEPGIGDVLYWPADLHHVGEGVDGKPSTSVNIGVPTAEHDPRYDLEALLGDLTVDGLMHTGSVRAEGLPPVTGGVHGHGPDAGGALPGLPAQLDEARALLLDRLGGDRVLEASALHRSARGLEPVPARMS